MKTGNLDMTDKKHYRSTVANDGINKINEVL